MLRTLSRLLVSILVLFVFPASVNAQDDNSDIDERLFERPSEQLVAALDEKRFEASLIGLQDPKFAEIPLEFYQAENGLWTSTNVLHLKLSPEMSAGEINEFLIKNELALQSADPELGILTVRARLADSFPPDLLIAEWLAANAALILRYSEDPRVLSATPDFGLSQNDMVVKDPTNDPTGLSTLDQAVLVEATPAGEYQDWGLNDIQAPELWLRFDIPLLRNVAVFDTGFNLHEDLPFIDRIDGSRVGDHGNHVAGILCALHNGKGTLGVLPYCGIRAKVHGYWIDPSQPGSISERASLFQAVMESFKDMVDTQTQVAAFNVSLGYNWYWLKGLDPTFDFESDPNLRIVVEAQARFLYQVLARADQRGIPIVSAAGNDSRDLASPFDARWASPFNYAALTACEARNLCNGVVVEAHDPNGNLAKFSNAGGSISCPGVNIRSAVSKTPSGPSATSYGVMSGTSMASPYCAGGLVLLSSLLPNLSVTEIMECVAASPDRNSIGTPMMRLGHALASCE